jgi:hypothetical protein
VAAVPRRNLPVGAGRPAFLKKRSKKTFDHFGFGLSGKAQPSFARVFGFFFSKKNGFLPRGRALAL